MIIKILISCANIRLMDYSSLRLITINLYENDYNKNEFIRKILIKFTFYRKYNSLYPIIYFFYINFCYTIN